MKTNTNHILPTAFALLGCVMLAGCLSPAPKAPTQWLIEPLGVSLNKEEALQSPSVMRLGRLIVLSPYDKTAIAVRRVNGSVAFDEFNAFAAPPSSLLKDAALSQLKSSARNTVALPRESKAKEESEWEIIVHKLYLDCQTEGERIAKVELTAISLSPNRTVTYSATAVGDCNAFDGNYSKAFSEAFAKALRQALK